MVEKNELKIVFEENPNSLDDQILHDNIIASNKEHINVETRHFSLFLRDSHSKIRGGISLYYNVQALYIDILWIEQTWCHRGNGSQLLRQAETEGHNRGCQSAIVDTFDFQAVQFYQEWGYHLMGEIKDYLMGHARVFLKKQLKN